MYVEVNIFLQFKCHCDKCSGTKLSLLSDSSIFSFSFIQVSAAEHFTDSVVPMCISTGQFDYIKISITWFVFVLWYKNMSRKPWHSEGIILRMWKRIKIFFFCCCSLLNIERYLFDCHQVYSIQRTPTEWLCQRFYFLSIQFRALISPQKQSSAISQ